MEVRAHFELIPFISFFDFVVKNHSNAWLMFILLLHDSAVSGFGRWQYWHYKERGVFEVGNCQAHAIKNNRALSKSARTYGGPGGRSTDFFGGPIGWNCKFKMVEWHSLRSSSLSLVLFESVPFNCYLCIDRYSSKLRCSVLFVDRHRPVGSIGSQSAVEYGCDQGICRNL